MSRHFMRTFFNVQIFHVLSPNDMNLPDFEEQLMKLGFVKISFFSASKNVNENH